MTATQFLDDQTRQRAATPAVVYEVSFRRDAEGIRLGEGLGCVTARVEGEPVGGLIWNFYADPPQVTDVAVDEDRRRQGIATTMWEVATSHESRLTHSDVAMPHGRAWIESLNSRGIGAQS